MSFGERCIEPGCDQAATSGQRGWRRCRVHHNARKHAMRRRKRERDELLMSRVWPDSVGVVEGVR